MFCPCTGSGSLSLEEESCFDYDLGKKLSDTLQGEIRLAKNKSTKKDVIIKVAIKHCVKNQISTGGLKILENFKEECYIHRKITNYLKEDIDNKIISKNAMIGFVTCEDYFKDKLNYYLVMEYCKNGDLFEYIANYHNNNNPLSQSSKKIQKWNLKIRHIFRQMVWAVFYMHSKNIAHQDLSLENVMIFDLDSLYVKIIDFGLSQEIKHDTKPQGGVGKCPYMSPECYSRKEYDPYANDIWCLGVMLFIMLVGFPPPIRQENKLQYIINGSIHILLNQHNCLHLVDQYSLDCLNRMLTSENRRISIDKLMKHPFVAVEGPVLLPTMKQNSEEIMKQNSEEIMKQNSKEIMKQKIENKEKSNGKKDEKPIKG